MMDGRNAAQPYRVRAGGVWYWVDPTRPRNEIGPGDTVIVYPVSGEAHVLVMRGYNQDRVIFATPEGDDLEMTMADVAAMHLAAVDDEQDSPVVNSAGG